ncbi:hypothetical protein COB21_04725, partial [Candidatus Aerophobetes bacterium]
MKKIKKKFLLCVCCSLALVTPLGLIAAEKKSSVELENQKGHVVCELVERAFQSARGNEEGSAGLGSLDLSSCEAVLLSGEKMGSTSLVNALKGYLSVSKDEREGYLEDLISTLGRQLKNSVDNPRHHLKDNDCLV